MPRLHHAAPRRAAGDTPSAIAAVTAGDDLIRLRDGVHDVDAGDGADRILARDIGASLLAGGGGDDVIRLDSAVRGSTLRGGEGDDVLRIRAPSTAAEGGAGDDVFRLDGGLAGGSVIVDAEGRNRLVIDSGVPPGFRREAGGDDLHILLGGGTAFDPTRDVVWKDFFGHAQNSVNGLDLAAITALIGGPGPDPDMPSLAQQMNAANAVYSRDYAKLPPDLAPFLVAGQHLALEVTDAGFYAATFVTPENQLLIAFEGTHISGLSTQPTFVAAQIAADVMIFLGQVPPAFLIAETFTAAALLAAAGAGIAAEDVFVTGHSLGAGIAMHVGAVLDMAGMTFAAPGITAATIPPGQPSRLVNYVEYGDPVGNYSANPDVLGAFVQSPDILRYGDATYVGDPLAAVSLAAAGSLFGPGTTPAENAAGIVALAALAAEYHPLERYAADLGVVLADPHDPGSANLLPLVLAALANAGFPLPTASENVIG
ncbi:MAG: hypothetical protein K2X74_10170 [Acetobacteraceae bacterium]|nr:hypothetical protein [Acetobacteraceae bacterium]